MSKYKPIVIGFQRTFNQPLEADTVFESLDKISAYINGTTAYNGQIITLRTDGNGSKAMTFRIDEDPYGAMLLNLLVDGSDLNNLLGNYVNKTSDQVGIKGNKSFEGILTFANNKPIHFGSSTSYRGSIGYDYSADVFCFSTTKTKIRFYANRAYTDNMSSWGNTTPIFEIANTGISSTYNFNFSGTSSHMPYRYYHNTNNVTQVSDLEIKRLERTLGVLRAVCHFR